MKCHLFGKNVTIMVQDKRGFTLLELVVVIIIMGVLSLIALRSFTSQTNTQRFEETRAEMEALKRGIVGDPDRVQDGFRVDFGYVGDMGALPAALTDLAVNPGGGNWNGPYIQTLTIPIDPWSNEYEYMVPGPGGLPFGIRSYGADAIEGGQDNDKDITTWETGE